MSEFFATYIMPTKTIYSMWVIMAVIVIFAFICTRRIKEVPGPLQNVAEIAVKSLLDYFAGVMGERKARQYFPMLATFFVLIIVCNYCGLLPGVGEIFTVPTSVLAVTVALSTISFFMIQTAGIKKHGALKYFLTFFKPVAVLFPIMLLEQFVRPISMALRLYGNIYGEELATDTLYGIFQYGLPLVMNVLSLLFCFIQAMVFTMLLAVFINEATEDEEEQ